MNQTIKNITNITNVLFIGCNPRLESPLLNTNFRKAYLNNILFKVYSIGLSLEYSTYPILNLGSSIKYLYKFLLGKTLVTKYFLFDNFYNSYYFNSCTFLNINIFLGNSLVIRSDFQNIFNSIISIF
jgi:hypothetical protein